MPSISTSRRKPATTQIEAHEIRRSLEIKRHNKSQCDAAGDQTTEEQHESASDQCLDENLLNLKTCRDVVKNESLSSSEKHDILQSVTALCSTKIYKSQR